MPPVTPLHTEALDLILDDAFALIGAGDCRPVPSRKRLSSQLANAEAEGHAKAARGAAAPATHQDPGQARAGACVDEQARAVAGYLAVGRWNDLASGGCGEGCCTVAELNQAARTLGLVQAPTHMQQRDLRASCKRQAPASPLPPRAAASIDWDYVLGPQSFDKPQAHAPRTSRGSDLKPLEPSGFSDAVASFLAVGAWNDLPEVEAPSADELRRAARCLGLEKSGDDDQTAVELELASNATVTWGTVESLLSEPMHARAPSPASKRASATAVPVGCRKAAATLTLEAAEFGSFSSDCISGLASYDSSQELISKEFGV